MNRSTPHEAHSGRLTRVVGVPGAVLLGLGSILGTGIFVSVGLAAGIAGGAVLPAVMLAAVLAGLNGLSSAQLAAAYPVSGGTYEYGYRTLCPTLGFTAGWMFLAAKTASAATAALGFAGYTLHLLRLPSGWQLPLALLAVVGMTVIVAGGMRRSNRTNAVIVSLTVLALLTFVVAGLGRTAQVLQTDGSGLLFQSHEGWRGFLEAMALMFVAYTGYGRIATLGEEVRRPRRSIPRAIIITLVLSMLLYSAVTLVALALAGPERMAAATAGAAAPLVKIAREFTHPVVGWVVAAGAITALIGVLLNLLLGLSRVLLAMARRRDMPWALARITEKSHSPRLAVMVVGGLILLLVLVGDVKTTWSFSAFTVLIYYALTNLAALRLPAKKRLYPRILPVLGLLGCLGLAFWVQPAIWLSGLVLIGAGLVWKGIAGRLQ